MNEKQDAAECSHTDIEVTSRGSAWCSNCGETWNDPDGADVLRKELAAFRARRANLEEALAQIVQRVRDATPLTGGPYAYSPVGRGSVEGNLLADVQELAALALLPKEESDEEKE